MKIYKGHAEICIACTNLILNYLHASTAAIRNGSTWNITEKVFRHLSFSSLSAAAKMAYHQGYSTCHGWDIIQQTIIWQQVFQCLFHSKPKLQHQREIQNNLFKPSCFNCGEWLRHTSLLQMQTYLRSKQELRHAVKAFEQHVVINGIKLPHAGFSHLTPEPKCSCLEKSGGGSSDWLNKNIHL